MVIKEDDFPLWEVHIKKNFLASQALTSVGPTRENPVLDSLAVQHLNKRLCISPDSLDHFL